MLVAVVVVLSNRARVPEVGIIVEVQAATARAVGKQRVAVEVLERIRSAIVEHAPVIVQVQGQAVVVYVIPEVGKGVGRPGSGLD